MQADNETAPEGAAGEAGVAAPEGAYPNPPRAQARRCSGERIRAIGAQASCAAASRTLTHKAPSRISRARQVPWEHASGARAHTGRLGVPCPTGWREGAAEGLRSKRRVSAR